MGLWSGGEARAGLRSGGGVEGGAVVRGRGGRVCGEARRLRKVWVRSVRGVAAGCAEGAEGAKGAEGAEGGGDGGRGSLVCLRTCETLFEGSLCLATIIDASWPGAGEGSRG